MRNNIEIRIMVVLLLISLATPAWAKEKDSLYPSLQEIYEDCQQAVKIAETDMKGFLRTSCAARINAVAYGPLFEIAAGIHPPATGKSSDLEQNTTLKNVLTMVCFPWNDVTKEYPIEYFVAKKITEEKGVEKISTHTSHDFWPFLREMYPCNLTEGE